MSTVARPANRVPPSVERLQLRAAERALACYLLARLPEGKRSLVLDSERDLDAAAWRVARQMSTVGLLSIEHRQGGVVVLHLAGLLGGVHRR